MAAAIAVQARRAPLVLDHFFQPRQHRRCRFLFHQLRIVNLAVGVVQNDQQVVPALVLKPAMFACRNNAVCPYFSRPNFSIFSSYP